MLEVRLLGQFDVRADGKRVIIPSRAGQSLVAFLILTAGTAHRREKLAGLFWPETTDENARGNLRRELWRVRKALASQQSSPSDYLLAEELTISFNPHADYWLDVAQLDRTPSADDIATDLIQQLSLYRGELLPGFYDDWVMMEREHAQAVFERKIQQLLERLVTQERWGPVLEWGERWIALGHTPEPAYRALMLAHGARGDMAKVATLYQRCADGLRDDLGVEPSAETRALYEGLIKGSQTVRRAVAVQSSGPVTFLFTDIEGSTNLLERLGDRYAAVLLEQSDILRAAFQKWSGREVSTRGDGFFVAFTRATDAMACAVEIQRALAAHPWPSDGVIRVRMGLHTGESLMAESDYIGMEVHRAARIGDVGHGGQVLLSQATHDQVAPELPEGVSLRDLGVYRLKDVHYPTTLYQLVIAGLPSDFPPLRTRFTGYELPEPGVAPFKGLAYFDVTDADWFYGREVLTAKLIARLRDAQFLSVIVGASGSGKSSVVRAGLVPAVRGDGSAASGYHPIYVITPTAHPLEALAISLTQGSESVTTTATLMDDLTADPRALYLFLRRQTPDGQPSSASRPLLVVDQFEELFTLCRDEFEREAFIDNLLTALTPPTVSGEGRGEGALTLILTLRADFYAYLAHYPDLREAVALHQEYIGPMTTEELRRAIEEPAKRGGWEFEPGLVDLILRDVGDEPGALPLLSHALLETWRRRTGHRLTLKGYHEAGGVRGAIAHTAESVYRPLSPTQQTIARHIFLRLTELGEGTEDTRRRVSMTELPTHSMDAEPVRAVLNVLAEARLITLGQDTAEVAHEALIREWPTLREWLNQDREGLRLHRHLTEAAQDWMLLEREAGTLYRGARLAQVREWAAVHPGALNTVERAFLEAAEAAEAAEAREREAQQQRELDAARRLAEEQRRRAEEQERSAKALRRWAVYLSGALVVAGILAVAALFFGQQASVRQVEADTQRLEAVTQRNASATAQAEAVAQRDTATKAQADALVQRDAAEKARADAELQRQTAFARELAVNAVANLDVDPERSILLALQAVTVSSEGGRPALREAEEALHRAVQTSRVQLTLRGHTNSLDGVAFSPDGTRLATRSLDGTARLWDASTGRELLTIPTRVTTSPSGSHVGGIAFSLDGTRLITSSPGNTATLWDAKTGAALLTLMGHSGGIQSVAFSPDNRRVATASVDKTARVWDAATGQEMLRLSGHTEFVIHVAFSPDGSLIATASQDGMVHVWDATTAQERLTFRSHPNVVRNVVFSPDGKRLATAGFTDGTAKIWDATSGQLILTLFRQSASVNGVAFNGPGTRLATGGGDGVASIWDVVTGQLVLELHGHSSAINQLAFSQDNEGNRLLTGATDSTARVWDLSLTAGREWVTVAGHTDRIRDVAYSLDGTRLVTASTDKTAKVWDAATGKSLMSLTGHTSDVRAVAISPDGRRVATTSDDGTARLWDPATGTTLFALSTQVPPSPFTNHSLAFSPDGRRLALENGGTTAKIYDTATGQVLVTLPGHEGRLRAVTFSRDGRYVGTAGSEGVAKIWDAASGKELMTLAGHKAAVYEVAFSLDGSRLATAGADGTAKVWDAATGKEVRNLVGHNGIVFSVAFSPDSTRLATSSSDATVKVWNIASTGEQEKELLTLYGHRSEVSRVVYSPDGRRLATASRDGTARVYALPIEDIVAIAKTRVTRELTCQERRTYLHVEVTCP